MKQKQKKKHVYAYKNKHLLTKLLSRLLLLICFSLVQFGIVLAYETSPRIETIFPELPSSVHFRVIPTPPQKAAKQIITKALADSDSSDYCVSVPILFYHHVEPIADAKREGHAQLTVDSTLFDEQMAYLKSQNYTTVSMDDIVQAIVNKRKLPTRAVALTFDDGYSDIYDYAYPILQKYGFVGNFAIPTGLIDNDDYLTWDQLSKIAHDPAMHIYNHTWTHSSLSGDSQEEQDSQIVMAQNDIQTKLGLRSDIFFYPYGSYNNTVIKTLTSHGYIAAVSTLPGTTQCESSLMFLHRTRIGNASLSSYGL